MTGGGVVIRRVTALLLALALLLCVTAVAEDEGSATEPAQTEAPQPAKGYVLVSTATQSGWLPLPEEGEVSYPLRQLLPDGTEAENVIHLTPDGVYMEDSTCEGHDCVDQGVVTLENRNDRVLGNMIICLPNQVTLQLFTPEEILAMMSEQAKNNTGENE